MALRLVLNGSFELQVSMVANCQHAFILMTGMDFEHVRERTRPRHRLGRLDAWDDVSSSLGGCTVQRSCVDTD
jgi:hypothetical protein